MDEITNLTVLPASQKQAIAKTMLDLDYRATEIAELLGIHRATVYRYGEKSLREGLRQYATELKALFTVKQTQIMAKILNELEKSIQYESNTQHLINAFVALRRHTPSLYEIQKSDESNRRSDMLELV